MRITWLILLVCYILAGCSKEQGASSEIVIPPGGLIQIDLAEANLIGERMYSLQLMEQLETLQPTGVEVDVVPKPDFYRKILPKSYIQRGPLVTKVVMELRNTPWFAIMFPEEITAPSYKSTLIYNLLSNYPGRAVSSYTKEEIAEIDAWIENFKRERMDLFNLDDSYNPDHLYVFLRNGLSASYEFLTFLEKFNVSFNYDNDGNILSEPFPFGVFNRPPVLDEGSSTKQVLQNVDELKRIEIRALALDPDGDQIFYSWLFEGEKHLNSDSGRAWWNPGYTHSRPSPYVMSVLVTDGGKITRVNWNIMVANVNRRPLYNHSCTLEATEFEEWTCIINYEDTDLESVRAVLAEIPGSNPIYINDLPAPAAVDNQNSIRIRWTPNNADALVGSGLIQVQLIDSSNGLTMINISVRVIDKNVAPQISNYVPSAPIFWEYDQCAMLWGPAPGAAPNEFSIDFTDDDNSMAPLADPLDQLTITRSGTLNSDISEVSSIAIPGGLRKRYRWTTNSARLTGTFELIVKDDHGGSSVKQTYDLVAQNINQSPCMTNAVGDFSPTAPPTTTQTGMITKTYAITDDDGAAAYEIYGFQNETMIKFVRSCLADSIFNNNNANNPVVLRRAVYDSDFAFRVVTKSNCIRFLNKTNVNSGVAAGYIRLLRSSEGAADIALTTAHIFTVVTATRGTYQYRPTYNLTVRRQDLEVLIPVNLVGEYLNIPTGRSWTMSSNLGDPGITVSNPSVINDSVFSNAATAYVRLTRTNTASNVTIPRGHKFFTNWTAVHEFESPETFIWPAGSATFDVPVWKVIERFPSNITVTTSAPLTGFTLTTVGGIANSHDDQLASETYYDWLLSMTIKPIDGFNAPVNTLTSLIDPAPAGVTGLTVRNAAALQFDGQVTFTRPAGGIAFTLPAGFRIGNTTGTHFATRSPVLFAAGEATKNVWVKKSAPLGRIQNLTDRPEFSTITNRWRMMQTNLSQRTGFNMEVYEGVPHLGTPIEYNHRDVPPVPYNMPSAFWQPDAKVTRMSFLNSLNTGGAAGAFRMCREPGLYSATCTSCQIASYSTGNATSAAGIAAAGLLNMSYFSSARCYIRYNPNAADLSRSYSVSGTARQHWGFRISVINPNTNAVESVNTNSFNATTFRVNFNYIETNDPPVLTDSNFAPIVGGLGTSHTAPINLGAFQEGVFASYNIYATDPDRGNELKVLGFELDPQVFDLSSNTWRPRPRGINISVSDTELFDVGSRVTGLVSWTPTDEDSKMFSGPSGFVIRVRIYDSLNSPSTRQHIYAYYRLTMSNRNQVPYISALAPSNRFTLNADTYWSTDFYVYDNDAFSTPSFETLLTLCRNGSGNPSLHPTLDAPSVDPYICHASSPYWTDEVVSYDPSYDNNVAETRCRTGSVLNEDLAVPKLSAIGAAETVPVTVGSLDMIRRQLYRLEWCPQRNHIGEHSNQFFINDNGDSDAEGNVLPRATSSAPINFNVVAPVYWISPRNNVNGQPLHYMPQTSVYPVYPFVYKTIVKNARGNLLEYSLLNKPGVCGAGGMCISDEGVITWSPTNADITPVGQPGHLVTVRVRDTATNEIDTSSFYLIVQNPLDPLERSPVINSFSPASSNVQVSEKQNQTFTVSGSDPNPNDQLFYRWYVNNKVVYDEGPSFNFKPSDIDGGTDPDGPGPLGPGDSIVRVEVTDGNTFATQAWNVKVKNTILLGNLIFDIMAARPQSSPSYLPSDLQWRMDVGLSSKAQDVWVDTVVFGGSYTVNYLSKHFIWNLRLQDGVVNRGGVVNPPWNFDEKVPWGDGKLERLAIKNSGSSISIIATSAVNRIGPFGTLSQALNFGNSDISNMSWGVAHRCQSTCVTDLYTAPQYSDDRITASYSSNLVFFASDDRSQIYWDPANSSVTSSFYNFGTDVKVSGLAVNTNLNRLYVTTQRLEPTIEHRLWIFNVGPAFSGNNPVLVGSSPIFDGVVGHEDNKPTDIVVDLSNNRVFTYLSGTGGLATFVDHMGVTAPSYTFIGVDLIGRSPFDNPGEGRRLLILENQRLIVGSAKDASQLFTVDLDSFSVKINAISDSADNIIDPGSGYLYLINRSKGRIYMAR